MDKKSVASIILAAALALVGCSSPSAPLSDAEFIAAVHADNSETKSMKDDVILTLAKKSCDALDNGASVQKLVDAVQGVETTQGHKDNVGYVIGFGISNYCPEHEGKIK